MLLNVPNKDEEKGKVLRTKEGKEIEKRKRCVLIKPSEDYIL